MNAPILLVPGIGNSDDRHWQTRWQHRHPGLERIAVDDWDHPQCGHWVAVIDAAVRRLGADTLLVGHSLGCLAIAHWAAASGRGAAGALLVAVPDPHGPAFPADAHGFSAPPQQGLPWPSIMVCSDDDPYAGPAFSARTASMWGCELVAAGPLGHVNSASGLGDWDAGWALVQALRAGRAVHAPQRAG